VADWEIYLDLNGNGQWDEGEPKTTTAADGSYAFTGSACRHIRRGGSHAAWLATDFSDKPGRSGDRGRVHGLGRPARRLDGWNTFGGLEYSDSLPGLAGAGTFAPGNYVQYTFPTWSSHTSGSDPSTQGTVEMWVKPETAGALLNLNWNNTTTIPPLDTFMAFDPAGYSPCPLRCLERATNTYPSSLAGTTPVTLGEWTHIAISWSPEVSKIYINGQVDVSIDTNVFPALGVDRLRVSQLSGVPAPSRA
jgi:hypothetical protein